MHRIFTALNINSDSELADILGITPPSIAGARKRGLVPGLWVEKIAQDYKISADWLLFGRGPMRPEVEWAGGTAAAAVTDTQGCDVELRLIPMVEARISAGQGSLETSGKCERSYAFRMDFLLRKGNPDTMILMRVAGDSMAPEIDDGDVVLLDQAQRTILPGRIYAVGFEEAIYLKRIDMEPGKVVLKSVNTEYRPVELDVRGDCSEQFRVIGKVLWSGREYR